MKPKKIIIINQSAKYFINSSLYMIFMILSFGEIYRIILYLIGCSANFTIKKIVSSRIDLSGAENNEAYDKFNPKLQIFGKEIKNYQSDKKITPEYKIKNEI